MHCWIFNKNIIDVNVEIFEIFEIFDIFEIFEIFEMFEIFEQTFKPNPFHDNRLAKPPSAQSP